LVSARAAQLAKPRYRAVVVGTGFGGAVAACRLAQAGIDVAVLERGRRYPPGSFPRDVVGDDGLLWHRGAGLYDIRPLNDMLVVQAAGYGGGSLVYANVNFRPPPDLFADGWPAPYSRGALDPYYDLVAHMLDVRPVATTPIPTKTQVMVDAARRLGRSRQTFRPNLAVTFGDPAAPPRPNQFGAMQAACTGCGECIVGCNVGAKNTLDLTYLAAAERHGADVATGSEVTGLDDIGGGFRIHYRDPSAGRAASDHTVEAGSVFLCLGAVNTTELLLRCRDQHRTLPRLSDRLGEGYSGNGDFLAFVPGASAGFEPAHGPTITMASVHDRTIDGERAWFVLEEGGYPPQLARLVPLVDAGLLATLAERDLQPDVRHHATRDADLSARHLARDDTAVMLVMGRDRADGRIELVGNAHRLHVRWDTPANLALYAAQAAACGEVAAELGGRLTLPAPWRYLGQPISVHNLGGCRMADDPARGVVDADGSVFGYPGLHVLDGAILPTATGANPSATIAAIAERCIEHAIRRMTGAEAWKAPESASAHRRAVPEDGVVVPAGGTPPLRAPSGGVRYVETMHGEARIPVGDNESGPVRRFRFRVTSTAVDVGHFVADPTHPTTLSGTVWVDGLTGAAGAPVVGGTFHLFPDSDDPLTRIMSYVVPFRAPGDGRLWVVRGRKVVGGGRIRDLWRALTTMEATVGPAAGPAPGPSGEAGWARIDTAAVARMLASFRVIGGDGRMGAARGLLSFYRFFGVTIARLYVAGLRARWAGGRRP
jgi:cholesterol oxidase